MTTPEQQIVAPAGYTLHEQIPDGGGQTTWAVTRDVDGTGLGAFASQDGIDRAVERDKGYLAKLEARRAMVAPPSYPSNKTAQVGQDPAKMPKGRSDDRPLPPAVITPPSGPANPR